MATVGEVLQKVNGRGIYLFKYGYEEVPSSLLLFYDLKDLNNPNFDFNTARPKNVVREVSMLSDERHKIKWYEEDLKEHSFTATSAAAAGTTSFDVSINTLVPGDTLFNPRTSETMTVVDVVGNTVTVDENVNGVNAGDVLLRGTYAKTYAADEASSYTANDMAELYNYIQYTQVAFKDTEMDLITNNLSRLFYNTPEEYLRQEVFARVSRKMVLDMMRSLYVGKRAALPNADGTRYLTGGLDYFIRTAYPAGYEVNIAGATADETIQNLRDEVTKSYKSGVPGLYSNNRLVMFVNTAMGAQIDDLFMDKIVYMDNYVESFGINMKSIDMNGRKITLVEDPLLNYLYPDRKVGYIVDLQGIGLFQLANDVVDASGRRIPRMPGVAKIFAKPQIVPEKREVYLFGHWGWIVKNVTTGVYRKLVYA